MERLHTIRYNEAKRTTPVLSSLKRKALYVLIILDILFAISILAFSGGNPRALTGWLFLNLLVIIPAAAIKVGLWQRRRKKARFYGASRKQTRSFPVHEQDRAYGTRYMTQNGEAVKSGGEKIIADYLNDSNIRYEYEKSAMAASNRRISRPDFYLSDYGVYVEYWGMVNTQHEHTRQEYVKSMEWKIAKYHENGIKFISIYPEDLGNLDSVFKKRLYEITRSGPKRNDA